MARNGSGTYSNPYPNFVSGTVISSTEVDTNNSQIATALTQSIAVDGQSVVTGDIPLATHKFTAMKVGAASTDSLSLGQAQAEAFVWCGTAGGGADAITLSPSPAITAYAAGQRFVWMASGSTNTTATTVAISGLGAIALQDNGAALTAGQHAAGKMFMGILNTTSTVQIMQVQVSGTDPLIVSSLTVTGDATIGDDLTLLSDASILGFGENTDVTLTHVHDTGLLLNSTRQLQFNDASQYINAPTATVLDINATDEIELNATAVDINATLDVSGVTTHGGNVLSDTDSTDSLGSSTVRWAGVWTDAINGGVAPSHFEGKNRIDNPSGVINQRGAQTGLNGFFSDRWVFGDIGAAVVNGNTVSGYLEVDVTTVDSSIAAGDLYFLQQSIEGFNTSDLLIGTASAKTITISFKHKHTKTGIHCVSFVNGAANRNYIFEYTQSVSNTEETHSETVTLDTSGTWIGATNGIGLKVFFCAGGGSTFQGSADTWQAGNLLCTSNQVNDMDSVSNYFRITDVQLEVGTVATPLEYETYSQTLAKCQRYLPAFNGTTNYSSWGSIASTTVIYAIWNFPVHTRIAPTGVSVADVSHFNCGDTLSTNQVVTGVAFSSAGLNSGFVIVTSSSGGLTATRPGLMWGNTGAAQILFTGAEL